MSNLLSSAASLSGLLNIVSPKVAATGNASDFQALLDVSHAPQESDASDARDDNSPAKKDTSSNDTPQPQGAYVQTALPPAPSVRHLSDAPPADRGIRRAADAAPVKQDAAASANDVTPQNDNTSSAPVASDQPAVATPKASASQDDTGAAQDDNVTDSPLRAQLEVQLGNISQLLMNILQAMQSGAAPVQAATDSAAAPVISPAAAPTTPTTLAQPLTAVVQDMQALLAQLQQMLAGNTGNTQTTNTAPLSNTALLSDTQVVTPVQPGSTDKLQSLTTSLQQDMAALMTFLQSQGASAVTAPATPATDTAQVNLPDFADIKSLLKANIAQIKDQLQQIKHNNETTYATAKANFQNVLASFGLPQIGQDQNTKDAALPTTVAPVAVQAPVVTASADPVVPSSVTATPVAVQFSVAAATSSNTGGGNAGQDNGAGGQPQSQPQGITPLAAGQSNAAGGAATTTFSKTMEHVARGSLPEQVAVNIKTALSDGSSRIRIQLDPADLGKLDIKINVSADGKTGLVITADHQSTLDLLHRDAPDLMRALNDMGLKTDSGSLSFNLRGDQQQPGQQQAGNAQGALTYRKAQPEDEEVLPVNVINRSYVVNLAEGLDIKI